MQLCLQVGQAVVWYWGRRGKGKEKVTGGGKVTGKGKVERGTGIGKGTGTRFFQ